VEVYRRISFLLWKRYESFIAYLLDADNLVINQGFYEALEKGTLSGNPITNCRLVLQDGAFHIVDSSELAFRLATIGAFREVYRSATPVILEPIMKVEVVAPVEFQSE